MNEHMLRSLVREAVAKHLGEPASPPTAAADVRSVPGPLPGAGHCETPAHPSHGLYAGLINVSDACVIEPAVTCDHCGYCKSHGH